MNFTTDAIADYFRALGVEPDLDSIRRFAPPLKYVNADFRVYPLILGEKDGTAKIRLLSDASELHLGIVKEQRPCGVEIADQWFGPALKVTLRVGPDLAPPQAHPAWLEGYLPVACFAWEHAGVRYRLQAFGATLPHTAQCLCAWMRLSMERIDERADARWRLAFTGVAPLASGDGFLYHPGKDTSGLRGAYSDQWLFDASAQCLDWALPPGQAAGEACVVVADQPPADTLLEPPARDDGPYGIDKSMTLWDSGLWLRDWAQPEAWQRRLDDCTGRWRATLDGGGDVRTPEPYVNHAQRAARIGAWLIANRDQMNYSVHNSYERMYGDESAQASVGLAYWGHFADAARYIGHSAFHTQIDVTAHDLGSRLHWFCRYLSLSDDSDFLARNRSRMERWAQWLLADIAKGRHGLGSPTGHCGDLHHIKIHSLSTNCTAWRGLRDFARLTGNDAMLKRADEYRAAIRRAAEASLDTAADPPFLPMSLYGDEPTPAMLGDSSLASYWGLLAPYALYANALGDAHPGTRAMLETFARRGGLCAGLVRFAGHGEFGVFTSALEMGMDDLYGAKLSEAFARRDDPDPLVLALYGKLAIGLTPDTFIAGECASLAPSRIHGPGADDGRSLTLPPNSASQMFLAILLRHCLVFDMDSREDGVFDTLRLAFSTPRRWLEEGQTIEVMGMPTAFGSVSYRLSSFLKSRRAVAAAVRVPVRRTPAHLFLRLRVPAARGPQRVTVNGKEHTGFDPQSGTLDLSGLQGSLEIEARYG